MTVDDQSTTHDAQGVDRLTWAIRPGIHFPDWSAIRSPTSECALKARLALRSPHERWMGYGETEDRVRTTVLNHYTTHGRAPTVQQLRDTTGLARGGVRSILERLRQRDLVVLDAATDRIVGAYPFTDRDTGHVVRLDGLTLNALCAIDALGVGAMCGRDIAINSRCAVCAAPIKAVTRAYGAALGSYSPDSAVVWSALNYAGGCGATSSCVTTAFFCSDRHLDAWRNDDGANIGGHRLSIGEGHEVGVAIFGPMLATS